MTHRLFALALLTLSLAPAAQIQAPPAPETPIGTEALPGKLPGTRRFNVTFRARSFDLGEFRQAIQSGQPASVVARIVEQLDAKARQDQLPFKQEVEALGGRLVHQFWLINACTMELDPRHVATIEAMANVAFVHPDLATWPLAPILVATNASNHNADAVQSSGLKGTGLGIAIVDTGQDSNMANTGRPHQIYFRNGSVADTTGGGLSGSLLFVNRAVGAGPADDTNDHGTGVLGIAGGSRWNNAGGDHGHAYDTAKLGYSICDTPPGCGSSLATEAAGWQAAAADRAQFNTVAGNMSYSSTPNPLDVSQQAIDSCAINADLLPVTAAANNGSSTAASSSTANGLAVAACNPNTRTVASFSSRGPLSGDTARFFPDILANGVNTVMPKRDLETSTYLGSGTSMASPQVCGAAALVKSARPGINAREIKAVLLCNTENVAAQNPSAPYNTRNAYGMGYLRDDLAVANSGPGKVLSGALNSTTTPDLHLLQVTANQQVSVVLVFHRHVLSSTAWSNLGLRVLSGTTVVAQSNDPRNLYEVVRFTAANTGVLTIEVSATSLEIPTVPYSIATNASLLGSGANFQHTGDGCPGARGRPALYVNDDPMTGSPFTVGVRFGRSSAPALLVFGAAALNIDLGTINAPGCFLRSSLEVMVPIMTDALGTAALTANVPNDPSMVGGRLYCQALVSDPVNGANIVTSQSGVATVGTF